MKRSQRRTLAAVAAGAVSLPALLLATAPAAQAAGLPIAPVGLGELPYCEDLQDADDIAVGLDGVPEESASPTEWTEFTYVVTNVGEEPVSDIFAKLEGWYNVSDGSDDPFPFSLQWNVDGEWRNVPFESDTAEGHFGVIDELAPGETAEAQIRTRAEQDRPGWFEAWVSARHFDEQAEGTCYRAENEAEWALVAEGGEAPGEETPEEQAEPDTAAPASEPNSATPQGDTDDPELAETGSSSATPLVAGIGGAVLVAGGGAVMLARRARA
ncbi:LAETG motif-containing sortase-dependent surface protein [Streptomyces sedi]|uniref:LAETG motif-containing sortase-dependent surface protein n=1 Tax=Streptomyces sedi TaxID=555059 RepID=UPI001476BE99|nr:LAETG motif-containing sortase-dependent surface protein [Streptomyces sedi]